MKLTAKFLALFIVQSALFVQAQIPYPNPIRHVIFVIQENRTPDNLFHGLLTQPGINPSNYEIATSGLDSKGQTIVLHPVPLGIGWDLGHGHQSFVKMYDGGKMDGADKVSCLGTCPTNPQFGYVDNSTRAMDPYLTLATQFGWANFMFQTNQGPSYPAHQFLFGGTSATSLADDARGVFISENPAAPKGSPYQSFHDSGCLAPLGEWSTLIYPNGSQKQLTNSVLGTFCFSRTTMASLLDQAGLTWKYYAQKQTNVNASNPGGSIWTAPNSIREICGPDSAYTVCTGLEWKANVDLTSADVLTDISACNLANVTWVTPDGKNSDHAGNVHSTGGPSWVAAIVNAVGNAARCDGGGGYWPDTAIVITWDDWGGWYDHVAPPILHAPMGDYQYGFRVPLLVVSAYTPRAFVSNEIHDFGSMLRFVEGVFSLGEGSLGVADARANDDLSIFFNFRRRPRNFQLIPAPLSAAFFIHDTSPPEPPDND